MLINRLYILNNESGDRRGSYYLENHLEFMKEKGVIELIEQMIAKNSINKLFFAGTSKGGGATLNIVVSMNKRGQAIIIGAPQYNFRQYFLAPTNAVILKSISGTSDSSDSILIYELDNHIGNKIIELSNTKIYLHYFKEEHLSRTCN